MCHIPEEQQFELPQPKVPSVHTPQRPFGPRGKPLFAGGGGRRFAGGGGRRFAGGGGRRLAGGGGRATTAPQALPAPE